MNINEYQNKCLRTFNQSNEVGDNILQCLLGIQGESGEVIDIFKKHFYQGHELIEEKVIEEIGDVMWYIANLCNSLELDLSEILNFNIQKLQLRFPQGFSIKDSIKRVDTLTDEIRPTYYNSTSITPFDYIRANKLDFFEANVVKYITRYKEKNGLEDLLKAQTYLKETINNYKTVNKIK